jgi:hypothetical protein
MLPLGMVALMLPYNSICNQKHPPSKRVDFGYNLDSQFDTIDRYISTTASAANLVATSSYGYDDANRLTSLTYVNDTTTYAGFGYGEERGTFYFSSSKTRMSPFVSPPAFPRRSNS